MTYWEDFSKRQLFPFDSFELISEIESSRIRGIVQDILYPVSLNALYAKVVVLPSHESEE
jgi:hypothetical protein